MIIRHPVDSGYAVIANATLEDGRLSWKARGLLAFLLAKPDGWEVMVAHLINSAPDGRDSVMSGLRELEEFGYLVRRGQARQDQGRFDTIETEIHECPVGGWPQAQRRAKSQVAADAGYPSRETRQPVTRQPEIRQEELPIPSKTQGPNTQPTVAAGSVEVEAEVTVLCNHLANCIEQRSGHAPAQTAQWRKDMDLLVRRGPSSWAEPQRLSQHYVEGIINGVFAILGTPEGNSTFCWADQVRSPGNLRRNWDQIVAAGKAKLRLAARDPLASSSDVESNLTNGRDALLPKQGADW